LRCREEAAVGSQGSEKRPVRVTLKDVLDRIEYLIRHEYKLLSSRRRWLGNGRLFLRKPEARLEIRYVSSWNP
jgi:hypothetical protein